MERIKSDKRFSRVLSDPRFRGVPKKHQKVKIDKRFQTMLTNKRFELTHSVDKRGRPVDYTVNENLERYFEVSSEEENSSEDSDSCKKPTINETLKNEKPKPLKSDGPKKELAVSHSHELDISQDNEESTASSSEEDDEEVDLARGEGNIETSSESSDDSESDDEETKFNHPWGELDHNVPEASLITHRLAVCNMDWDRIKANDLLMLFNSFKPSNGVIKSVKIYETEFGKERMKEEELKGPQELVENQLSESEDETSEGSKFHMEKLRTYQINRLKYFYAVVECDNAATANKIYEECDGVEYECSASRVDLRFIPDDMKFDENPCSEAVSVPDNYRPNLFITTALQQAKVDLTWDETDPSRIQATQEAFLAGKIDEVALKSYIASASESENEAEDTHSLDQKDDASEAFESKSSSIAKYQMLLQSIEEEEKKNQRDVEMEITWEPGLKENAMELIESKKKENENLTPWQQYLEKKKEKKKEKKEKKLIKEKGSGSDENPYSDDDLPTDVNLSDPFFQDDLYAGKPKKMSRKKKYRTSENTEEMEKTEQEKAELALLIEDDEERRHFNSKTLFRSISQKGKKKKKSSEPADEFQVDVVDPRFQELYTSHLFNMDPSDPNFKRTKGTEAIMQEKQRRRQNEEVPQHKRVKLDLHSNSKVDPEISVLVKGVKSKSMYARKAR